MPQPNHGQGIQLGQTAPVIGTIPNYGSLQNFGYNPIPGAGQLPPSGFNIPGGQGLQVQDLFGTDSLLDPNLLNFGAEANGSAGGGGGISGFLKGADLKGYGSILSGASGIADAYLGLKNYGLGKKQFRFNKKAFNRNLENQANATNFNLESRIRSRASASGQNGSAADGRVAAALAKYGANSSPI